MKIAQICPRYSPDIGGVETHVKEISERLVRAGHDVEVITTDPTGRLSKRETINGVKVIRFRSFAPGNAYYFAPQIYYYLKKHNYDVIHAHSYHAFPAFFSSLGKHGGKFILTPHYHRRGHTAFRNLLHKPYKLLGKLIFFRADSVICVSEYEKKLVESDFKVATKTVKIPNGINLKEFENLRRPAKGMKRKAGREKLLLYVGRLEEYKGVQYIIQSLPELHNFQLRIVGKGPYETELRNMAKSLGVEGRIEWLKDLSRKELLKCYADADIFLMLSSYEAYGITVAEALAADIPCIVAKESALEEFVDGENCIGIENPVTKEKVVKALREFEKKERKGNSRIDKSIMDWDEVSARIEKQYTL
ncbi:MAG: glycosyltransferase family 4 protein [Methanosarcina flavescens]|uniref:Glycosyltransferase family 1 protein n=1 Tax=Methanosarcina flavescens TaxID=1715806 RepID=A0A660HQ72_9EURY|nr:glycosyltransferase family 4 protein [Methanosarcina flavescens]AYK14393.1 glycosyltransferase family 1 protein [Methanosarcina flavescens]NLK31661.1 glycosyltransferase family 4 protein [Methanosarcina flavescens]